MIRPSESQQTKENLPNSGLGHPTRPQSKIKRRKMRDKYQDLAREQKNMEHKSDDDTNCKLSTQKNP